MLRTISELKQLFLNLYILSPNASSVVLVTVMILEIELGC
jgi:hypothetical protein